MSIFDITLEKRFTDSETIAEIDVSASDVLLIRNAETGVLMRITFETLSAAISSAFASSFASLVDGKVPASQLPSYVDDVLEYADIGAFPVTGESGKIYVAIDTNKTYRWSGSAYVEISASLALGETSSTAYRGDLGKTAYDHSQATGNPHGTTKADIGLSNVDNTSDANKPVSTAQQTAFDAKANKAGETFTGDIEIQKSSAVALAINLKKVDGTIIAKIRANQTGELVLSGTNGVYLRPAGDASGTNQVLIPASGVVQLPGSYVVGAPSATGYVTMKIGGTDYKFPVST